MKKSRLLGAVCAYLFLSTISFNANAALINVASVLDQGSAASQMFSSGDLTGSLTTLTPAAFDALSVSDLIDNYDAIIIGCCDSTDINADFTTRLLPYLNQGGGIVFENPFNINLTDLSPAITATGPTSPTGITVSATVPGLTDGILDSFANSHITISSYDGSIFSEFLSQSTGAAGLYGEFSNGGRMVITAPDNFLHGQRSGTGVELNQYNLALNELQYVTSGSAVPIPAAVWLFASGLFGLIGIARHKKAA